MKQIAQVTIFAIIFALSPFSSTFASEVGSLHTFVDGTTAQASQVNDNFTTVETAVNDNAANTTANTAALPIMWASTDMVGGGVSRSAGYGSHEVNSVSITVPSDGYIIISGNIYVNNDAAAADLFYLSPYVDGAMPLPYESAATVEIQATGVDGEATTLSYTVTVAITSGTHTVSQNIEANINDGAYFYNRNNMTVLFIPSSQGSLVSTSSVQTMAGEESGSIDGKE